MAFDRSVERARSGLGLCFGLSVVLGSIPAVVFAAPSAAERETARSLMDEADRLVGQGDLDAALARYESAHAIMHVPTTGLSLARTQALLGLLVEARSSAMEVINLPVAANEPNVFSEARRAAGSLATELEPRVPSIKTTVIPADVVYTLTIDAVALPPQARLVAFRTNPGPHSVKIEAPGYAPETRQVTLTEGQRLSLELTLQPMAAEPVAPVPPIVTAAPVTAPAPAAATSPVDPAGPGRVRGIIGLSVGGAALVAGSIAGVASISKTSSEKKSCPGGHCLTSQQDALSSANTLANVANICIPIGVLGIAYGLYELFTLPSAPIAQARTGAIDIAWTGTGAVVRGSL